MRAELILLMVFVLIPVSMLPILTSAVQISLAQDAPYEVLDETGTHFELQNLNVFITTDAMVHIVLHASSEFMYFSIENAGTATSTQLTLGTLRPSTTYYLCEDGYENEKAFVTDDLGSYTYDQDLSQPHLIIIQPTPGTITIYESTTLQSDIHEGVSIGASDIVLDLNGYSMIGPGGFGDWLGILIWNVKNVTVKNGGIKNFIAGIAVGGWDCENIVINNCTIGPNQWMGFSFMGDTHSSIVANNTFASHGWRTGELSGASDNKFYHNNFDREVIVYSASYNNIWDDGYPSGGNYWSAYAGTDQYSGPDQDLPGSDGIADLPYVISYSYGDTDNYPLMSPWTPRSSMVSTTVTKGQQSYPISMFSNSAISDIKPTPAKLDFTVTGESGMLGYVRVVIPVGLNTTDIKVFLNHTMIRPPPYPVIATNGTHYFIYFAFEFRSFYEVTILFEPYTAAINIDPDTLNLKTYVAKWITCYVELPLGCDVSDIDISTILVNGTIPAELNPICVGDEDGDGIPDLTIKLDRAQVIAYITANVNMTELAKTKFMTIILAVTSELYDGTPFQGHDTIRIVLNMGVGGHAQDALLK